MRGRAVVGLTIVLGGCLLAGCSSGGRSGPLSSVAVTGVRPTAGETRTDAPSSSGRRSSSGGAENRSSSSAGRAAGCSLVSAAAIGSAFAVRVNSTVLGATPVGRPTCLFRVSAGAVGGTVVVTSSPALSAAAFAAAQRAARARSVSGLGAGAYLTEDPATVRVRRSSDVLAISASLGEPGGARKDTHQLQAALTAAAQAAIAGR